MLKQRRAGSTEGLPQCVLVGPLTGDSCPALPCHRGPLVDHYKSCVATLNYCTPLLYLIGTCYYMAATQSVLNV